MNGIQIIRERESSRTLNNSNYDFTHHSLGQMYGTRKEDYHHIRYPSLSPTYFGRYGEISLGDFSGNFRRDTGQSSFNKQRISPSSSRRGHFSSERNCPKGVLKMTSPNLFCHDFQDSMEPKSGHSSTSEKDTFAKKYLRETLVNKNSITFSEEDEKIKSMIWQGDEMDNNDDNVDQSFIFKFSSENIPKYDGKTVVGDEGVFEVKLFRCTFCNMLMMDKDKSRAHMLTEYHYNTYKNYLIKFENEKKNQELKIKKIKDARVKQRAVFILNN